MVYQSEAVSYLWIISAFSVLKLRHHRFNKGIRIDMPRKNRNAEYLGFSLTQLYLSSNSFFSGDNSPFFLLLSFFDFLLILFGKPVLFIQVSCFWMPWCFPITFVRHEIFHFNISNCILVSCYYNVGVFQNIMTTRSIIYFFELWRAFHLTFIVFHYENIKSNDGNRN